MENRTARLTLLIDPKKKQIFEEICAQQDLTSSQVVRRLIHEYIIENTPARASCPNGCRHLPPTPNTSRSKGRIRHNQKTF